MSSLSKNQRPPAFSTTREGVLHDQQHALQVLLTSVWQRSAFYREYYQSHGIREHDLPELTIRDLPFVTKQTLMEHFDLAITDTRLRKQELEQWLERERDPRHMFHRDFIVLRSSGSSGSTAIFVYDRTAWQVLSTTMVTRFPMPEGDRAHTTRVAHYKVIHGHFGGAVNAARMPRAVYDVLMLSVLDTATHVVEQLNIFQPHRLVGYSSAVALLAEWALQGRLRIRPRNIIVGGDLLTDSMERCIQEAWGAALYVNYGTTESINLAVRGPDQRDMVVMDDLNILEVLDETDRGVVPGEQGRVVLTNLYNYTLPILRYELGDSVVRGPDHTDPAFTTIREIQGRVSEALPVVLDDGGPDTIHALVLVEIYVAGLEKIQFVSLRPDRIRLEYVAHSDLDVAIRATFQQLLAKKGASRTTFEVQRVRQIANDPRTGKFHMVRLAGMQTPQPPMVVTSRTTTGQGLRTSRQRSVVNFDKAAVEQSVPERFEQQVRRHPNRLAVQTAQQTLTYAELNAAANRVAHAILAQRGTVQEPVMLLLEHGATLIIGILGVLKAGKTYIALDPSFPEARLRQMAQDAQAAILLTNTRHRSLADALTQDVCKVCDIDMLEAPLSETNPHLSITPDHFASIVYTSGSAGQPKGVIQTHRNVLHKIMKYTHDIHIGVDDRLVLLASCSVGAAVWNMFGALLNGACLFPLDIKNASGVTHIAAHLLQHRITIYHSTPSVFRHFVATLKDHEHFPDLRLIRLAGEPVYQQDVELYKRHFSQDCLFYVGLATTETGCITQFLINQATQLPGHTVPAGYAVDDIEVLLLDADHRNVGVDRVGEIVVKSRYVSPGYWRKAELTNAVFMPDPEGGERRIYHTGDLGLMRPNGCLEHLGRKDWQVKIRGYRVELPEIEMALLALDAVQEVVVMAQDDGSGTQRLVAYLVPSGVSPLTVNTLRRALAETLPDYMIPSDFLMLDALPLTPNGKLDRKALPTSSTTSAELDSHYVVPRTATEQTLAAIWTEALSLKRVGIHDDFFDLGGHSLLATRIITHVRQALSVEIPLRAFFETPTVAGMALLVAEHYAGQIAPEDFERVLTEIAKLPEDMAQTDIIKATDGDTISPC